MPSCVVCRLSASSPYSTSASGCAPPALLPLLLLSLSLLLGVGEAFLLPTAAPTSPIATARSNRISSMSASSSSSAAAAAAAAAEGHVIATLHPNRVLELQLNRSRQLNALSIEVGVAAPRG